MDIREILTDAAHRPTQTAAVVLADIDAETLHAMPGRTAEHPGQNSIAWLVWHAARQMDVQLAELTDQTTVWERDGWAERLGVARGAEDFGFSDSPQDVAVLRVRNGDELRALLEACTKALVAHIATLDETALDAIVDESWDPPVSLGVRLVSIIDDAVAHLGQAAYVRGLVDGWKLGF